MRAAVSAAGVGRGVIRYHPSSEGCAGPETVSLARRGRVDAVDAAPEITVAGSPWSADGGGSGGGVFELRGAVWGHRTR